jgi:hypothetical protein
MPAWRVIRCSSGDPESEASVPVYAAEESAQNVMATTSRNLQKLRFIGTCETQESAGKKPGNEGMVRVQGDAIGANRYHGM